MTPEAIRTVGQVRLEFHDLFSASIGMPVSITKGNPQSGNAPKISWVDQAQRSNYVCLYAHIAPDVILPDRPLILRLGVNKGLTLDSAKRLKPGQSTSQKVLRFELTLLPDEVLKFVPWVTRLLQTNGQGSEETISPPAPLTVETLSQLLVHGAWTQTASRCLAQTDLTQGLENMTALSRIESPD